MIKEMTLSLGALCIGLGILVMGIDECRLVYTSGIELQEVDLSDLELGAKPQSGYLKIGEHFCLYADMVYAFSKSVSREKKNSVNKDKVSYVFYPIISEANYHRMMVALEELERSDKGQEITNEMLPEVDFVVLVKSKRFRRIGDLPTADLAMVDSVEGVLVNALGKGPDEEEKALIQKSYPKLDFNRILVLEEGRTPCPYKGASLVFLGVLLTVIGGFSAIKNFREGRW